MNEVKIKPYLEKQITAEEQFHDWLKITLTSVLLMMLDDVKRGLYSYSQLNNTLLRFKAQHQVQITNKCNEVAGNVVKIASNALPVKNSTINRGAYEQIVKMNLSTQIQGGIDSLFNQTLARVLSLIPFGYSSALYTKLFTDENNIDALVKRTNNSSMRFARQVYTEGVFNTLINTASLYGYSEYAADNRHDSRVRPLHAKYFVPTNWIPFNKPPICGHVGTEWGCRCYVIAVR